MTSAVARRRSVPPAPLEYNRRWPMRVFLLGVFIFLYAPLVALIAFSFNNSRRNIVWRGFTFDYYTQALQNDGLMSAFGNSLAIAAFATGASVILGTMAAIMLWRFRFAARPVVESTVSLPIVVPEICMGVALLTFFAKTHWPTDLEWPLNLGSIAVAHVTFCFPFVCTVIRARLASFNREQEDAARDLGASDWQVLRDVLIPYLRPALAAGALLAFTLSLDDFVITFFTSSPDSVTFPVKVYSMVRFSVSPEVNAASALLIALTVIVMIAATWIQQRVTKGADPSTSR